MESKRFTPNCEWKPLLNTSEYISFQDEFSERLQFNQHYDFIKKNKIYVFNKDIPHNSCLCETCENATLLGRGINLSCQKKVPTNAHKLVETYVCDSNDADCMAGECDTCLAANLITDDFCGEEKDSKVMILTMEKSWCTQKNLSIDGSR